jgi:hypothetical protein
VQWWRWGQQRPTKWQPWEANPSGIFETPAYSFIPGAIYQPRPQLISSACAALSVPAVLAFSGGFWEAIQHF